MRKEWKKEVSAGGVVYRLGKDGPEVLLIWPEKGYGDREVKEVWTFPKGWIGDHGEETMEEAALREVREEGGVVAKIIAALGDTNYTFASEGVNIDKTVHYYLMEYISGDTKDHDHEVREARWFLLDEAGKRLTYGTEKGLLDEAKEYIVKD